MGEPDRRARAEARRCRATLRKTLLSAPDLDEPQVRGPEAVSLVHRLTLESWSLAGLEFPAYGRRDIPVRFVRGRT
jgi:hypothetical protein